MVATLEDVRVEQPTPDTAVVVFSGDHDLSTKDEVRDQLGSLVASDDLVIADFSSAAFVDTSILGVLLDANEQALGLGGVFRLQLGTADIVRRAVEICGVFDAIEHVATREEAIARGRG